MFLAKSKYILYMGQKIKISERKLKNVVKESIEKYFHAGGNLSNILTNQFSIAQMYRTALFEAAFIMLGYERFAIDGEITFGDIMDNPWDDAYAIIDWAIKNKGLDKKYLGRISQRFSGMSDEQYHQYIQQIQSGKDFWFTKEELSEILSKLPSHLGKALIQDMLNVGRVQKIYDTVQYLTQLNGGENMEIFFDELTKLTKGKKWNRQSFLELVKQALAVSNMLPSNK